MQIGLYVHRIRVSRDYERLELGGEAGQYDLKAVILQFCRFFENNFIESDGRLSKLANIQVHGDFICGEIRYGSTGLASDIVDSETDEVRLRREKDDVEVIPLYFCFYVPDGEDTWYVATQSFGGRSCSTSFNRNLRDYAEQQSNYSVMVQKVMPLDDIDLAHQPVQKLTMIRKRVPPEDFEEQLGDLARELKIAMSISLDGRGPLGRFEAIRDRLAARSDTALVYEGIEFEEIQATVRIGSSYRKVGLIGASNSAGVVDISDLVDRDDDNFPVFHSIHGVTVETLENYMIEYRDQ